MKSLFSKLCRSFSGRLMVIGLLQVALWLGLSFMSSPTALAADTPEADAYHVSNQPRRQAYNPLSHETTQGGVDLKTAADNAEQLSKDVFNGLETTKQIKGKTAKRNQAIEHARDVAKTKLQETANKARSIEAPADLSPKESLILKNYQGQQ
ncbi:MAG TPA: hypothetical protein V6D07_12915 [Trichocoleus sp.]